MQHLASEDWQAMCDIHCVLQDGPVMFNITQDTIDRFSLAEILLMAAINQAESKNDP